MDVESSMSGVQVHEHGHATGASGNPLPPPADMQTIEEKRRDLTPEELQEYCKKVFSFKEVEVQRFKSWKERRTFHRQEHRRRMEQVGFIFN